MNTEVMKETAIGSLNGSLTFPEVVTKLLAAGVESYHVDLVRYEKRYYMPDGQSHLEKMDFNASQAALKFDTEKVQQALQMIQAKKITYSEFLIEILSAGCIYYVAYLTGKRVIYFGRTGEYHVERFPGST